MADRTIDGIMNSFQSGGEVKKRWGVDTTFEATPRKYDPSAPSSLDPENFVVQDLFVQNCTNNGAYYHIEMELYTISSDEQIIYQLKQIGQDVE